MNNTQREYLFKVYDKTDKCWLMNGDALDLRYCIEEGILLFDNDRFNGTKHECVICQFTGLHDKNGKRIWEGDKLLWGEPECENRQTVIVSFEGGCFGFSPRDDKFIDFYAYLAQEWRENSVDMSVPRNIQEYFQSCFEVIGNLHDNPELLTGKEGE